MLPSGPNGSILEGKKEPVVFVDQEGLVAPLDLAHQPDPFPLTDLGDLAYPVGQVDQVSQVLH